MSSANRLTTLIGLLLWGSVVHAQQASPQLRYFAPEDYQGDWQVFGMAQDHQGRVYAAVPYDSAVYCFDGANWERIDMPSAPLTIEADHAGRICVGHDAGISRLERDADGRAVVRPLKIAFEEDDPRRVSIPLRGTAPDGFDLTFANSRMVFDVREDEVRIWRTHDREQFVGRVAGVKYVKHLCQPGVFQVQGDDRIAVPGLESVSVSWVLSTRQHDLLALTTSDVLIVEDGQTRVFSEELAAAMPATSSIYWCWPNQDGTVSVGTTTGFYCCDGDGRLLYQVDRTDGLETDVVISVFQDSADDLWLSTEVGLAHVSHSSRDQVYTIRNPERRITDLLYAMDSSVLVGRRGDPYILEIPSMQTTPIPQLQEQLLIGAAECDGRLYAVASDMVCLVDGSSVTPVLERRATAMSFHGAQAFAALALMEDVVEIFAVAPDGQWQSVQSIPLQHRFADMKVAQNGDILGISYDGTSIARIRFDDGWSSSASVEYFTTPPAQLLISETFVLIVSEAGWLDYDPQVTDGFPFVPAGCLQQIDHRHAGMATFTRAADLLVAGERQIRRYPLNRTTGKYSPQWNRRVLAAADIACEPVEVGGLLCVAHANGLSVYREGATATLPAPRRPVISMTGASLNGGERVVTAKPGSSVRFHFATPVFSADRLMEYQVRLLPSQSEWSEWSEESSVEYADLTPGTRTFQVRSRVRGQTYLSGSQTSIYVVPFWYQTAAVRLSALAGLILILGGTIHLRDRKAVAGKQRLEAEVESRTAMLADANLQLQQKIRLAAKSEQARAELAVRYQESERLESLGAMAGGIAHDFNNLLAVIVMQTELLKLSVSDSSQDARNSIDVIEATTDTAAQMCRQILAASCSSPLENKLISLHDLVRELHPLLRTSVTPHPLRLELELHADQFCGDASQIKQAILNLVVNAREAQTDERAPLIVRTGQSTLTMSDVASLRCIGDRPQPGEYVWVCISDPGPGLDAETQRRMFDPFYSTKAPGRGLGMATVLQTSSRHGGGVQLSRINGETQFTVYLPVSHQVVSLPAVDPPEAACEVPGGLKVLLIDDEPSVRESASQLLAERDFEVLAAASGEEGLQIFRENPEQIDLAILDISLPGMNGHEVATRLLHAVPGLPIVMMSGFSEETVAAEIVTRPTVTFLKKPFRSQGLYSACTSVTSRRTG